MRKFFLGFALLALVGLAMMPAAASAKRRMVHCDTKNKIITYPHIHGTFIRCYSPGWWIWVKWPPAI